VVIPLLALAVPFGVSAPAGGSTPQPDACGSVLVAFPDLDEVVAIDPVTGASGTPIHVGDIQGDQQLTGLTISPDAKTAYATTDTQVIPIDLATGTLKPPIIVPQDTFGDRAKDPTISPDGSMLYVSHTGNLAYPGDIVAIDLADGSVGPPVSTGGGSVGQMAFVPDGTRMYVGDGAGDAVTPIDVATFTPGTPINIVSWPSRLTITPDGRWAYVDADLSGTINVIDLSDDTVVATLSDTIYYGPIAANPDGKSVLVTSWDGKLIPIDVATKTPGEPTPFPAPRLLLMRPDGRTAVIISSDPQQIATFDLATRTAGTPVALPSTVAAFAQAPPDQPPTADLSVRAAPTGQSTTLDASASTVECGSISSYAWDFGDGTAPQVTTTPTVDHTYTSAGTHQVTVTETDSAGTSTARVSTGQTVSRNGGPSAVATATVDIPQGPPSAVVPVAVASSPQFTG